MNFIDKIAMYITSMIPLPIVICGTYFFEIFTLSPGEPLTYSKKTVVLVIVLFFVSLFWVCGRLFYLIKSRNKTNGTQTGRIIKICNIKRNKGISIEYLMSFTLAIAVIENYVVTAIYLIILGYIYVKYNLVKYNLCLELAKYTLYDCEIKESGKQLTIYSKTKLSGKSYTIQVVELSDDTALLTDCFDYEQESF